MEVVGKNLLLPGWNMGSIPDLPHNKIQGVEWRPHGQAVLKPLQRRNSGTFYLIEPHSSWKPRETRKDPAVESAAVEKRNLSLDWCVPILGLSQVLYWDSHPQGTTTTHWVRYMSKIVVEWLHVGVSTEILHQLMWNVLHRMIICHWVSSQFIPSFWGLLT